MTLDAYFVINSEHCFRIKIYNYFISWSCMKNSSLKIDWIWGLLIIEDKSSSYLQWLINSFTILIIALFWSF